MANPFPDPVKMMESQTVSDSEKREQMWAESKLTTRMMQKKKWEEKKWIFLENNLHCFKRNLCDLFSFSLVWYYYNINQVINFMAKSSFISYFQNIKILLKPSHFTMLQTFLSKTNIYFKWSYFFPRFSFRSSSKTLNLVHSDLPIFMILEIWKTAGNFLERTLKESFKSKGLILKILINSFWNDPIQLYSCQNNKLLFLVTSTPKTEGAMR